MEIHSTEPLGNGMFLIKFKKQILDLDNKPTWTLEGAGAEETSIEQLEQEEVQLNNRISDIQKRLVAIQELKTVIANS